MKPDSTIHVFSYRFLLLILLLLLVLTGITVGVSRIDLGALNIWAAIAIASVKAGLVLLFFMHLRHEPPLIRYSFLSTIGFLAILIGFMFWDIAFR